MGEVCCSYPALSSVARAEIPTHRFGPDYVIDPVKDYTKLTLDAISLASMSYRMNSFYTVSRTPTLRLSCAHLVFRTIWCLSWLR